MAERSRLSRAGSGVRSLERPLCRHFEILICLFGSHDLGSSPELSSDATSRTGMELLAFGLWQVKSGEAPDEDIFSECCSGDPLLVTTVIRCMTLAFKYEVRSLQNRTLLLMETALCQFCAAPSESSKFIITQRGGSRVGAESLITVNRTGRSNRWLEGSYKRSLLCCKVRRA